MSQPLVLQVFLFKQGQFLGNEMASGVRVEIGRDADCDIVLDDEACSRKHAVIFEHDGQLAVQDLGSANGTRINGEPLTGAAVIGARDDIGIGQFTIKLKSMSAIRPATPAAPVDANSTKLLDREAMLEDASTAIAPLPSQPSSSQPDVAFEPAATEAIKSTSSQPESLEELLFGGIEGEEKGKDWDPDATINLEAGGVEPPTAIVRPPRGTGDVDATMEISSPRDVTMGPMSNPLAGLPAAPLMANPALNAPTKVAEAPTISLDDKPEITDNAPPPASALGLELEPVSAPSPPAPPPLSTLPPASLEPNELLDIEPAERDVELDVPSLSFDGLVVDEEDDDEEPEEDTAWSLVQRLVREPSPDATDVETAVLEVIHYRNEKVLDHVALQPGESFKFGRTLAKEAIRERGLKRAHKLVTHKKRGVAELRLHDAVSGKVLRQGQQVDLAGIATKKSAPFAFGEMGTLAIGGDTVYLRFTNEPKVVPSEAYLAERKEDLKLAGIATGIALGIVLLMLIVGWILQYRAHSQEIIQLGDEGFAEVYEKVEELELEKPEPEPEPMEEVVPEDTPPPETPQPDPTPKAAEKPAKKPSALAALQNIPKVNDKASSQNMKAALSNIKAVKVPGAAGYKLSALTGKGPSSGVQIGGAAGGVATSGLNSILRKTGGVGGLKGKKRGRVRGRVKTLRPRTRDDGGTLSRQEIQKVINQHISEIQYCYEKQLRTDPNLHGKVVVEWKIKRSGRVGVVKNKGSTLKSSAAISCMQKKIKRWKFPKPRGNGGVIVKYPFIFNTI